MVSQSLSEIPERTHEAVLLHLKRHGEMSVTQLCDALGVTAMAVRRHLSGLQKDGLVESRLVRQLRGRPTYRYRLTAKAESVFPSGFETLAVEILDVIREQSGPQGVMDILSARNKRLAEKLAPRLQNKNLSQRIAEVAKIFSESGYMTDWESLPNGDFFIYQRHCAVHSLANQYRQLCALEPKLIEDLLGVQVIRQQYMLNSDPVCGYLVPGPSTSVG